MYAFQTTVPSSSKWAEGEKINLKKLIKPNYYFFNEYIKLFRLIIFFNYGNKYW